MSPQLIKVALLITLLLTTFFISMLPLLLSRYTHRCTASPAGRRYVKVGLSLMSCFAAGVFLATCLLDLFPDASEQLEAAMDRKEIYTGYPVTEFLVVIGFLLVFLIEQIILSRRERNLEGENAPLLAQVDNHEEEPHDVVHFQPGSHSVIRSMMLLLALSLHSVFEGLAIGLQPTTHSVLAIFLPVALHKGILAFALGLNLAESDLSVKAVIPSNAIFAVTSPIGIGLGILITGFAPDSGTTDLVNGIIQAFACGTFLFVVFFEILPHEFMGQRPTTSRLLKTLLLVIGFATVSGLMFLDPDVRSPSNDSQPTTTATP